MPAFKQIISAVRLHDWWNFILPPIITFLLLSFLFSQSAISFSQISKLIHLILLAIPVAAFGFFINEWTDMEDDALAQKMNFVAVISPKSRWIIFLFLCFFLVINFIYLSENQYYILILLVQISLFILYSCSPFRWKKIPVLAVILDSLYSGPLFFVLASMFADVSDVKWMILVFLIGWLKGVRNIVYHLVLDVDNDKKAGVKSVAHQFSIASLQKLQIAIGAIEAILILILSSFISALFFKLSFLGVILILLQSIGLKIRKLPSIEIRKKWLPTFNLIYESWLPVTCWLLLFKTDINFQAVVTCLILMLIFPVSYLHLIELAKSIYFLLNDLYFIRIKPVFDIRKFLSK